MALSTALNFQCYKNMQDFFLKHYFRISFLGLHKSTNHNADYILKLKFVKIIYFLFLLHYTSESKERQVGFVCQLVLTLQNTWR